MKLVEAVIKPSKLDDVKLALHQIGIEGVTAIEVKGFGRQKGHTARYRGSDMDVGFVPKVLLKIVTTDGKAQQAVEQIARSARTGSIGDGKIFISDVRDAIRIRTGDRGDTAL